MTDRPKKIVVTGGSGKAGRACLKDLIGHGYEVFNVDSVAPREQLCPFIFADLADFGQTVDAFSSMDVYGRVALNAFDAIVHLAAIPAPRRFTDPITFSNNTLSTYNVFAASRRPGLRISFGHQARQSWGCLSRPRPMFQWMKSVRSRRVRIPFRSY